MLNLGNWSAKRGQGGTAQDSHKFVFAKSHAEPGIPRDLGPLRLWVHIAQAGKKLSQRVHFRPQARSVTDATVV